MLDFCSRDCSQFLGVTCTYDLARTCVAPRRADRQNLERLLSPTSALPPSFLFPLLCAFAFFPSPFTFLFFPLPYHETTWHQPLLQIFLRQCLPLQACRRLQPFARTSPRFHQPFTVLIMIQQYETLSKHLLASSSYSNRYYPVLSNNWLTILTRHDYLSFRHT